MPNSKGRRRRFGAVRRLPSGRWQARYPGPDGIVRPADDTFATKTEAEVWLSGKETELVEGEWIDPDAGAVLLGEYSATWIMNAPVSVPRPSPCTGTCAARTSRPTPGHDCRRADPGAVRRWRMKLLDNGVSPVTAAKAYRLCAPS